MVDIPNHEDSLRELSKTSLVNNVTVILCWSAAEAARYLELYKSYEHAGFAAIRGQQATGYAERLVEFVTVPRSINKADAVALVSTFGSLRHAINADPEQIAIVGGWGEKKVKAWTKVVEEPFRVKKTAKRRAKPREAEVPPLRGVGAPPASSSRRAADADRDDAEEHHAMTAAEIERDAGQQRTPEEVSPATSRRDDHLSDGVAAALARLREIG